MERYKKLGKGSGVFGYEIRDNYIIVQFKDGSQYIYNESIPGKYHVTKLKEFALRGIGLNSYINSAIKKNYAAKLR